MRKERIGVVVSSKMKKTVVVCEERITKHPMYKKYIKRKKKYMAHSEGDVKIGDRVRIRETRPLSKMKRWAVVEVLK